MITCAVCQARNHHLAIVCVQCGGFLQSRIDTLDLFATAWNIIERPFKAFHAISVARHKNYSIVLSAVAGIAITFLLFWLIKAGEYSDSLVNLIGAGFSLGPIVGIFLVVIFSIVMKLSMKALRSDGSFRNIFAVSAYALVPAVCSAMFILPVELMTFGTYFFTKNPSPYLLKPASYVVLIGLDALVVLWTVCLLSIGTKVLANCGWGRTLSILGISLGLVGAMVAAVLRIVV